MWVSACVIFYLLTIKDKVYYVIICKAMWVAWTEVRVYVRAVRFLPSRACAGDVRDDDDRNVNQFILIVFLYYYLTLNAFA